MTVDMTEMVACLVCLDSGTIVASGGEVEMPCPECPLGDPDDEYDGVFAGYEQRIGDRFVQLKAEIDTLRRQVAILQLALLSDGAV